MAPSPGGSVSGKDDLISVGPDGKGGRIKVLRSKPQFSVSFFFLLLLIQNLMALSHSDLCVL